MLNFLNVRVWVGVWVWGCRGVCVCVWEGEREREKKKNTVWQMPRSAKQIMGTRIQKRGEKEGWYNSTSKSIYIFYCICINRYTWVGHKHKPALFNTNHICEHHTTWLAHAQSHEKSSPSFLSTVHSYRLQNTCSMLSALEWHSGYCQAGTVIPWIKHPFNRLIFIMASVTQCSESILGGFFQFTWSILYYRQIT